MDNKGTPLITSGVFFFLKASFSINRHYRVQVVAYRIPVDRRAVTRFVVVRFVQSLHFSNKALKCLLVLFPDFHFDTHDDTSLMCKHIFLHVLRHYPLVAVAMDFFCHVARNTKAPHVGSFKDTINRQTHPVTVGLYLLHPRRGYDTIHD